MTQTPQERSQPVYLGDGVYVQCENGMLKMWTSDGVRETNVIYLEPDVLTRFDMYVKALGVS